MKPRWFTIYLLSFIFIISCKDPVFPIKKTSTFQRVEEFSFGSLSPRNVDIWLPPNYDESLKRYPVLYMHDGQMIFDPTYCWNGESWEVDSIATQLIINDLIEPIIIVGIWSTDKRYEEYCPHEPITSNPQTKNRIQEIIKDEILSDQYLDIIVSQLKPFIDKTFRTKPEAQHTAILGSSMGGLVSLYALCKFPNVFSKAGCMSTHWPGPNKELAEITSRAFISYYSKNLPPTVSEHKIYFDYGTETLDSLYAPYQLLMDEEMKKNNYKRNKNWLTNRYEGHGHSEIYWRKRLADPLVFLFGK